MAFNEDDNKILQLNEKIADEEKDIDGFYLSLGKAYFELHSDDYEPAFQTQITGIKNAEARIEDYKIQIKDVQGIVLCLGCGAEVRKTDTFCVKCGTRVERPIVSVPKPAEVPFVTPPVVPPPANPVPPSLEIVPTCEKCGASIYNGSAFCNVCGSRVEQKVAPKCVNCGAEIPEGSLFCVMCGTKAETAEKEAPQEEVFEDTTPKCKNCGAEIPEGSLFCVMCGTKAETAERDEAISTDVAFDDSAKCKNCGAEIPEGSLFCVMCGVKAAEDIVADEAVEEIEDLVLAEEIEELPDVEEIHVVDIPAIDKPKTEVLVDNVVVSDEVVEMPVVEAPVVEPPIEETPVVEVSAVDAAAPAVEEVVERRFCENCGKPVKPTAKFCIYCGTKQ